MAYYTVADLEKITIHEYDNLLFEKLGTTDMDIIEKDLDTYFPFKDADAFRQGACQLFADALKKRFGHKVYIIESGNAFHIFCKSEDGRLYIDVRGKTPSFNEFVQGLFGINNETDNSQEYKFVDSDFNQPFHDIGRKFAEAIIRNDEERYA